MGIKNNRAILLNVTYLRNVVIFIKLSFIELGCTETPSVKDEHTQSHAHTHAQLPSCINTHTITTDSLTSFEQGIDKKNCPSEMLTFES